VERYRERLSGPLLDRIDLHVPVLAVPAAQLLDAPPGEGSDVVRLRMLAARQRQHARSGTPNHALRAEALSIACALLRGDRAFLQDTMTRLHFSARALHRILRVARTIADLACSERVERSHLAEALAYRALDRGTAAPG